MNLKAVSIILSIITVVIVGLIIVDDFSLFTGSVDEAEPDTEEEGNGLTPEYIVEYLSENNFTISPVSSEGDFDVYTGELYVGDIDVTVQVDVYYKPDNEKVLLVESTIDGSYYEDYDNPQVAERVITEITKEYFNALISFPYNSSEPDRARDWLTTHVENAYDNDSDEKANTDIGLATISLSGTSLVRVLELDFGIEELEEDQ